jgi:hypothetical protein
MLFLHPFLIEVHDDDINCIWSPGYLGGKRSGHSLRLWSRHKYLAADPESASSFDILSRHGMTIIANSTISTRIIDVFDRFASNKKPQSHI